MSKKVGKMALNGMNGLILRAFWDDFQEKCYFYAILNFPFFPISEEHNGTQKQDNSLKNKRLQDSLGKSLFYIFGF